MIEQMSFTTRVTAGILGLSALAGCGAYAKDTTHFSALVACRQTERLDIARTPSDDGTVSISFACTNKEATSRKPSLLQLSTVATGNVAILDNAPNLRYFDVDVYATESTSGNPSADTTADNVVTISNSDRVIIANPQPLESRRA